MCAAQLNIDWLVHCRWPGYTLIARWYSPYIAMSSHAYHATASPMRTTRGCCTSIRRIRTIAAIICARSTPIPWLARLAICRWWVSAAVKANSQSCTLYSYISLPLIAVPPNILDIESTPSSVAVRENQNINMTCRADGFPTPKIIWRREDGEEIAVEKKKKGMRVSNFDAGCFKS